jgi:outer membrane protein assembly factor BamB
MIHSARRRWSKEFDGEIDGIAIGETGPVFLHGYDPPAGGKWIDSVIPGKLAAFDRNSGDQLWTSPCEVGYGRGFGSGLGDEGDVVVLGPSLSGHRIARMDRNTGELIGAREIEAFDQAVVSGDMCVTVTSGRVAGIMTSPMIEVWAYSRDGERYHLIGRDAESAYIAFTDMNRKLQGVLSLDVESGESVQRFLDSEFAVIHDMVVGENLIVLLTGDRAPGRFIRKGSPEELVLIAYSNRGDDAYELWRETVIHDSWDELPDVGLSLDSGKLYVARGTTLTVHDGLSGRILGQLSMPGLDERIAWKVSQGAGLLAEETRASVYELPA